MYTVQCTMSSVQCIVPRIGMFPEYYTMGHIDGVTLQRLCKMESKLKAVSPTQENGLAVLGRLAVRPQVVGCLAPAESGEEEQGVVFPITSHDWDDSDTALGAYMTEVICKAVLPLVAGEGQVPIGGCEAGLVILDCDHRIQMRHLADAMLRRVGKVAERHFRELPKHRRNERLSGGRGEQWKVVREALDRISLIQELL